MPFPNKKRVLFKRNPLVEVVCQLRFPAILKIESEIPADFQERIRELYPHYSESQDIRIEVPRFDKPAIPIEAIKEEFKKSSTSRNHEFKSDDDDWKINLTRQFIALTSKNYICWEEFMTMFATPLQALLDIYKPNIITRVGLRYVNVFKRTALDLNDVSWFELINEQLLGLVGSQQISESILDFENKYQLELSDKESKANIITRFDKEETTGEVCYMIDTDFFNFNKLSIDEAKDKLEFYHELSTSMIQWCIKEKLYNAMEPGEI